MKKFASTKNIFCAKIDPHHVRRFPLLRPYKAPIALKMPCLASHRAILGPTKISLDRRRASVSWVWEQALASGNSRLLNPSCRATIRLDHRVGSNVKKNSSLTPFVLHLFQRINCPQLAIGNNSHVPKEAIPYEHR